MTDEEIFRSIVSYKNFVTPSVERYIKKGAYIIEISRGKAFGSGEICGVTVANTITKKHEHKLCKCFIDVTYEYAKQKAMEYVNNL